MKKYLFLAACLLAAPAFSQQKPMNELIAAVQRKYAPDKRTAIFQVQVTDDGRLAGKTNLPAAKQELLAQAPGLKDEIRVLPGSELEKTKAIVRVSVCNIRSAPQHSAEMATQALLGTPLKVWDKDGSWLQVQTPDEYISWVDQGSVHLVTDAEADAWQKTRKLIVLAPYAFSYTKADAGSQTVSDIVSGDLVAFKGEKGAFYEVTYPDGRSAFIQKKDAKFYKEWLASLKITENSLVQTSEKLMGLPYLWGGTSFKGVDCSGFTKTVYFLNGVLLPRDASQQVHSGELVDTEKNWSALRPGDLLFFGKKNDDGTEKVVHVAMWVGNNQFIHASNYVLLSSVVPGDANYDDYNVGRYLRTKRILNHYQNALKLSPEQNN